MVVSRTPSLGHGPEVVDGTILPIFSRGVEGREPLGSPG